MTTLRSLYKPRHFFLPMHQRRFRWYLMVAHRRAGKTVSAVNDLIEKALYNPREAPRYGYIAPFLKQAKQIAWDYLKRFSAPYEPKINESELYVELRALPNCPRISIYGADNPDSFRGLYFDGVVLDEFGNMRLSIWREILLPALIDRRGWAVFMGTPNGPNHFRDMWYEADDKAETWGKLFLPVTATDIIPEEELVMMRDEMDPEEYAQEMLCSFEASVRGAIYARQMELMLQEGRIGDYHAQRGMPVNAVLDLGWSDDTSVGMFQERPDGIVVDKAWSDSLQPISTYIKSIKDYWREGRHVPGRVYLPHDAKAKSLQTGKSIVEQFVAAQLRPIIVPNLDILDGIAATRKLFPKLYYNKEQTKGLVLAMKSYHRKYDEERKIFINEPVHDWSSHYADMQRYMALIAKQRAAPGTSHSGRIVEGAPAGVQYGFALDDIWDLTPQRSSRL